MCGVGGGLGGGGCKGEQLTEYTPRDVLCNFTVYAYLEMTMMKPCLTNKHAGGFAVILQGGALNFYIR